jgi:hypothetical protein
MKPPSALALKGDLVEEWADRAFFRPLGYQVCRRLVPTRVTADQVTVVSLILGLIAGNLFFYESRWLNAAGVALFLLSDIFDSADGQLARTRGTSTPFGRVLDGASDNIRFINLYLTLIARLVVSGHGWQAVVLGVAAGISHALQSTAVDTIRQSYLYLCAGKGSELDLPETVARRPRPSGWRGIAAAGYASYVRRQARLLPTTFELVRATGPKPSDALRQEYGQRMSGLVPPCAWIGQNIRFLLLAVTAVPGWPAGYFWLTILPLNTFLVILVLVQERRAAALLRWEAPRLSDARVA